MVLLTCDIGTTGVKCALVDGEGTVVGAAASPIRTLYPRPGWAQQPVAQYLPALAEAARAAMERAGMRGRDIAAIGLSGTMNGIIPVDGSGAPLYDNIIHSDTRSAAQCEARARLFTPRGFYVRTGNRPDPHASLPKAAWLRDQHPELHAKTRWFLNTKDYVCGLLTGLWGRTDPSDAGLTAAYNLARAGWDAEITEAGGMTGKLPEILPSTDVSGRLTRECAALLGLPEGIPVAVGAGDGACATRGAGVAGPGGGYVCLGSSGWIDVLAEAPMPDDRSFHYPDAGGKLLNYCGTVQCVTAALDFVLGTMLGLRLDDEGFAEAEALAESSPPGANGLLFAPTLMGERTPYWDPAIRGSLLGLSLTHTRADIARAGYEGVAHALRSCLDVTRESGVAPEELILIGGGAKSRIWPGILASVLRIPMRVSGSPGEATALGAAYIAGAGCGFYPSLDAATALSRAGETVEPDAEASVYERAHERYLEIYDRLNGLYSG